jgi:hypothetical protein
VISAEEWVRIHRANVECGVPIELLYSLSG